MSQESSHSHDHHHQQKPDAAELCQTLRELGYRVTPQRRLLIDVLLASHGHLTVREVYDHVQTKSAAVDQATVYRTLELFHKIGFVFSSQMAGQTVYELASMVPHHHLVCRVCHGVQPLDNHHFEHLVSHLLTEHRFQAELAHLTISGVCGHCAEVKNNVV